MYKKLNINIQDKIDKYIIEDKKKIYKDLLKELEIINNEIEYKKIVIYICGDNYTSELNKIRLISSKILYLIHNKNERIKNVFLYYLFSDKKLFKKVMILNKYLKLKNLLPID